MPRGDGTGPIGRRRGGGRSMGRAAGKGRDLTSGSFAASQERSCVCPRCGQRVPHVIGEPCNNKTCSKCGTRMTRE